MPGRDRQRKRLMDVLTHISEDSAMDTVDAMADYLLDNGVSVELPPEPEIPIGKSGTVKLPNGAEYPALRTDRGFVYVNEDGLYDFTTNPDFVADPEPLTAEAVEELLQWPIELITDHAGIRADLRRRLAPYMARTVKVVPDARS
jgi:hypothetical protein